jgi:putative membrane protein insertion efficiency factor
MTWPARAGVAIVRAYQLVLGPFLGGACRFEPSCSVYAVEAISTHGLIRGIWLAARRIARCHPLGRAGYDPVPPPVAPR